jgi:Rap1a immunity proteins
MVRQHAQATQRAALSSWILATLVVILNYGVAVAQPAPATADYWMPGCRDAATLIQFSNDGDSKRDDLVKMGFCAGIINGLSYAGVSSGLCVPAGVTAQQAAGVVVQYIDGQAIARVNEDLRVLAFEALQAAWPCKN